MAGLTASGLQPRRKKRPAYRLSSPTFYDSTSSPDTFLFILPILQNPIMSEALTNTDLQGALPLIARGKVRDLYDVDEKTLLFVATDRISAYDVIMENVPLPQFSITVPVPLTAMKGNPRERHPPNSMHENLVQDPLRQNPLSPHPLPHPRPPASDPRVVASRPPEQKHAGAQAEDPPH